MAGIAEVEVDKATGKVTVVDYVAAVDCGTVINEALARVQAEGGIARVSATRSTRLSSMMIAAACAPATL